MCGGVVSGKCMRCEDVSAVIPFLVPRISVSTIISEVLCGMWRCWLYLGHSQMMCSLIWNV